LGHPVAAPLKVTETPGDCGEAGLGAFHVTAVQVGAAWSV